MILMLIKYWSLKKKNMANIIHLNTLLDIMILMLLDHYVSKITGYINEFNKNKNTKAMSFRFNDKQHF